MRCRSGKIDARVAVGLALTMVAFLLLARRLSLAQFVATLRHAEPLWLVPLILLVALGELARAGKWALILRAIQPVGIARLYNAIMIGYLMNIVLPLRVSPLVRAHVIRMKDGIPTSTVLATVSVDRLVDGFVSVGLLAGVLLWLPVPATLAGVRSALDRAGWVLLAIYLVVAMLLVVAARAPQGGGHLWLAAGRPLPRRARAWLVRVGRFFVRGLVLPPRWIGRLGVILLALTQKAMQAWQIQIAGRAFGVHLSAGSAIFLVLFLGAVVLAAGALGIRGGYLAAATVGLSWFGVASETGLAMGLMMDVASYGTVLAAGVLAFWAEGLSLATLRQGR